MRKAMETVSFREYRPFNTGELEADVTRLLGRYELTDAAPLIHKKRAGKRVRLR